MNSHAPELRRLDGIICALIAAVAAIELMAVAFGGFTLVWRSYAAPAGASLLLILAARYYSGRRNDPNLASALGSTAQLMVFAAVGAPLSYVAAAAGLPLHDAAFDAMDHALGFHWRALFALMQDWPTLHIFMREIYLSLTLQMTAVVLLLGFTGRLVWLRVYMLAFIFSALITIAISAALPAEGVWLHDGLTSADPGLVPVSSTSWPAFLGLRDGTFRQLMAVGAEGIITFPSLHSALAVIMIAAFWPVRVARWIGLVLNVLMLVATPIDGSHYLVDVLAGIAIAWVSLVAARRLAERTQRPSLAAADIRLVRGN
ncbi:MAG: phosphatase PAP2 family protein [Pseudolabrys sp.]